jgi:hypothetical protein
MFFKSFDARYKRTAFTVVSGTKERYLDCVFIAYCKNSPVFYTWPLLSQCAVYVVFSNINLGLKGSVNQSATARKTFSCFHYYSSAMTRCAVHDSAFCCMRPFTRSLVATSKKPVFTMRCSAVVFFLKTVLSLPGLRSICF